MQWSAALDSLPMLHTSFPPCRGLSALTSPSLLHLIEALGQEDHLRRLWEDHAPGQSYHMVANMAKLCTIVISLLPSVLEGSNQPRLVVYGAEMDEDRRR